MPADGGGAEPTWPRRNELLAVLLIALTAILAAWSAFEASKWGGVMSIRFSEANAARTESVRASDLANRYTVVDVGLLTNYIDAIATDDQELADFYRARFPERLAVATDAWLATRPLESDDAPPSPFDMEEYELAPAERAVALQADADDLARRARQANQRGDNYTITSVFLAMVLLLAALAAKVEGVSLQRILLVAASVIFLATGIVVATFPVEI